MSLSSIHELQEGLSHFGVMKMILNYLRSAKSRNYLHDVLAPLIEEIRSDSALDLETDPSIVSIIILQLLSQVLQFTDL